MKKPLIDSIETGKLLKSLRKSNNVKIDDLRKLFGFAHPQCIYAWEQGKFIPTIDNLIILSEFYNKTLDELIVKKYVEFT